MHRTVNAVGDPILAEQALARLRVMGALIAGLETPSPNQGQSLNVEGTDF
ncbi:hypothetical protein Kisp01_72560 [Kineosporia sp. NBRC 101677]|nr:hypothetical protein Kisp01_72560 [Kineosporia sp. NBRC 101677]